MTLPSSASKMMAKQAVLKGTASASIAQPEQSVSRLIVKLRNPLPSELVQPMAASRVQALSAAAGVGMKSVRAIAGGASLLALDTPLPLSEAKAVAARLARDSAVEYAEPDIMLKKFATPNDTRFFDWQWNLFAPTSTYTGALTTGGMLSATATGAAHLQPAWDVAIGHHSVVLAVIDTGIVNHPDLNGAGINPFSETYVPNGRFLAGYDFISPNIIAGADPNFVANDNDGRDADPSDPGDWVTTAEEGLYPSLCDDGQPGPQNSSWHGSHVTGIAAAMSNNATGIAGIGWNIRILPVRALGKCGGSLSDIAEAIRWAAGLAVPGVPINTTPAQVINLSVGIDWATPCHAVMQGAVNAAIAAGAVVVAATGDDGLPGVSLPAKCNGVIAVTAHTINGDNAEYANVGGTGAIDKLPTISAPGGGSPAYLGVGGPTDNPNWSGYYIWSTTLFGNTTPSSSGGAGGASTGPTYSGYTGTSAAAPQVAGVLALIKSMIPGLPPTEMPVFISSYGRPHPVGGACGSGQGGVPFFYQQCGAGLLDATLAVRAAALVAPPVILVQPQNASVLEGQTATFSVDATGAERIQYQWFRNGVPIPGATSASYTTPALTFATDNGTTYLVFLRNDVGTATSASATLAVAGAAGVPPPTGGGGGGGGLPLRQLLLLGALSLAVRIRQHSRTVTTNANNTREMHRHILRFLITRKCPLVAHSGHGPTTAHDPFRASRAPESRRRG